MPVEEIDWDKQDIVKCDERGRATLGSEFADQQVYVWIAETPDFDEEYSRPPDEFRDVLSKMASWASENDIDWYDADPERGVVIDKYGEEHETPHQVDGEVHV